MSVHNWLLANRFCWGLVDKEVCHCNFFACNITKGTYNINKTFSRKKFVVFHFVKLISNCPSVTIHFFSKFIGSQTISFKNPIQIPNELWFLKFVQHNLYIAHFRYTRQTMLTMHTLSCILNISKAASLKIHCCFGKGRFL